MNKKGFVAVFVLGILLFGVTVVFGSALKVNPITKPKEAAAPSKYRLLDKQAAFTLKSWDFEDTTGWTQDANSPQPWHTTGSCWWNGRAAGGWWDIPGYWNIWRQYLDTDPIPVQDDTISLTFQHRYCVERAFAVSIPDYPECDEWDVINVQASVNDSPFVLVHPDTLLGTGTAYGGTCAYAYRYWEVYDYCYGGWEHRSVYWDAGGWDTAVFVLTQIGEHTLVDGDTVVFRFEFISDPCASAGPQGGGCPGGPDTTLKGWYVDEIVVTTGDSTYTNHGTNTKGSLDMHTGYFEYPTIWVWDNLHPDPINPTHAMYVDDSDTTRSRNGYWISPWVTIPDLDSVAVVWIRWWQDQYVRGLGCKPDEPDKPLQDYMYVRARTDQDPFWSDLCYNYDTKASGNYDHPELADSAHGNWRNAGLDSLNAGYVTLVPDLFQNPGSINVQFAFQYVLNAHHGDPESGCSEEPLPGWGFYMDSLEIRAVKCYSQNRGFVWDDEASRPIPFSVPAGCTVAVSPKICAHYSCVELTDTAKVTGYIEPHPSNVYYSEMKVPPGAPMKDSCQTFMFPDSFPCKGLDTLWTQLTLILEDTMDKNEGDNEFEYNFLATDTHWCRLATYSPHYGGTATTVDSGYGIGVLFEPMYFNPYQIVSIGFVAWDSTVCRVHVYRATKYDNDPNTAWVDSFTLDSELFHFPPVDSVIAAPACITHPSFKYTHVVLWDTIPGDDWDALAGNQAIFVWIEQHPDSAAGPGSAFDTRSILGGFSFVGSPTSGWQNVSDPDQDRITNIAGEPNRDPYVYVNIGDMMYEPVPEEQFVRGDYDGDGNNKEMSDYLGALAWQPQRDE